MPANTIQPLTLLSVAQWQAVEKIIAKKPDHQQAKLIESEVVGPAIKDIEKIAGQEMDPGYVSYLAIYVVGLATKSKGRASDARRDMDGRTTRSQN